MSRIPMESAAFIDLARACAPQVHVITARALVKVESGFNPWSIGVVDGALVRQPHSRAEALSTARALQASGWNFSVGLAQINIRNLPRLRLTLESAFDACQNLRAMQTVLTDCFERARAPPDGATLPSTHPPSFATDRAPLDTQGPLSDQRTLRDALSCYFSGNFIVGYRQGYVRKVVWAVKN